MTTRAEPDTAAVSALLRDVAARLIMPRHRALRESQSHEKTPGEWVTIADLEAEQALALALPRLQPGALVIGEESASADASLLTRLDDGDVWIVDPLDGTVNFAAGRGPFAVMVGWLRDGVAQASWMFDPLGNRLFRARRGAGAYLDGQRLQCRADDDTPLRGHLKTRYMPPTLRQATEDRLHHLPSTALQPVPNTGCAGEDYPAIVNGTAHFFLYWRTLPWDHVPGALLLTEAGGHVARLDGTPYRASDPQHGLLVAGNTQRWLEARRLLPA